MCREEDYNHDVETERNKVFQNLVLLLIPLYLTRCDDEVEHGAQRVVKEGQESTDL